MLHAIRVAAFALAGLVLGVTGEAIAKTRVVVGTTASISVNPYLESNALSYTNGCQTYGCLGRYDFKKGQLTPMLAESWEAQDQTTWIFRLRKDVKWHNGDPVTAHDVVHSHWRRMNDPQSKQKANGKDIKTIEAVDDHTLKITTEEPIATLLFLVFDRLIVTNKKVHDQYGPEVADREHPVGFGPYRIVQVNTGQRLVLEKVPDNVFAAKESPDELIFQIMKEPEQRVTALLNGEIQIAQYIPPHMVDRIKGSQRARVSVGPGIEVNFLAMNPAFKPWDNKLLRQAVAYAIDRDTLVDVILGGLADRLDGPIGEGQYAYDPNLKPRYDYNPEKAKQLLKQAGFANGLTVDFYSTMNRYTNDKQTAEAMVAMLRAVGINAQLKTPEWAKLSADITNGKIPFYYYGRGSIVDPSIMMSQYFETGVTNRLKYSNPELDALLVKERATFDPEQRIALLRQAMSKINEEAPAVFLWRMKLIYGISNTIEYAPEASAGVFGNDIKVKN
ncbi:MAG TPA: ABC transporter substrate-binding protein [Beijerinckiaceae bacterium]|jgi:peptide/nickel transport system substrate-binding protein